MLSFTLKVYLESAGRRDGRQKATKNEINIARKNLKATHPPAVKSKMPNKGVQPSPDCRFSSKSSVEFLWRGRRKGVEIKDRFQVSR